MPAAEKPLHLFSALGVELEYMIVQKEGLAVLPVADQVLCALAGETVNEVNFGPCGWSNELALHVIELKNLEPTADPSQLGPLFRENLQRMEAVLAGFGARLLPTGAHPLMDPLRETKLWPHSNNAIYQAYDRIFGCKGHGWSNLQSAHLNLPFSGDDEFVRLHAAIRLLLPLLPALAASTPFLDGRATGVLDGRLMAYRHNQDRVPSVAGQVVPEPVVSIADYRKRILQRMYQDIAPLDPGGILQDEWLNSRGAIARFDRNAIEIRVLDIQECPSADLALAAFIVAVLKGLAGGKWSGWEAQNAIQQDDLVDLLWQVVEKGAEASLSVGKYAACFGSSLGSGVKVRDLLWELQDRCVLPEAAAFHVGRVLTGGCLARRILRAAGKSPAREDILRVYGKLADCLRGDQPFFPGN